MPLDPQTIVVKSASQIGLEIDLHESRQPDWPWADYRALQRDIEQGVKRADDLRRSGDYTGPGLLKALDAERQRALTLLKPFRDRLQKYDVKIAETIGQALPQRARADLPALFAEREIRDVLRGKDPLEVAPLYYKAIERGDTSFVRAVEDAPAAFPLLNDDVRAIGREVQIANSSLASEIADLRKDRSLIASLVGAALTDIDAAMPAVASTEPGVTILERS